MSTPSAVLLTAFLLAIAPISDAQLPALPLPPFLNGQGLGDNPLNQLLGDASGQEPPSGPKNNSSPPPPPPASSPPPRKLLSPPPPAAYTKILAAPPSGANSAVATMDPVSPPASLEGIAATAPFPLKFSAAALADQPDSCTNFGIKQNGFLETPWTQQLDTTSPRPAYPRPQMVRRNDSWANLNGRYQFFPADANTQPPFGQMASQCILVPFPMESALSGLAQHYDYSFYSRQFTLPASFAGKSVLLHANRVDREATYYVNGVNVGQHIGGYAAHYFDITQAVKADGSNELVIGVYDPTEATDVNFPLGKQRSGPAPQSGITYTSSSGPWSNIWLEAVPAAYIISASPFPDLDNKQVTFELEVSNATQGATATVTITDADGATVSSSSGSVGSPLVVSVPSPAPWSPASPTLYNAHIALSTPAVAAQSLDSADAVDVYFGFNKVVKAKSTLGIQHMQFNNEASGTFLLAPLYQGFFSDGVYAGATDGQYADIISRHKVMGFNLIRIHAKVEDPQFYYQADKQGIYIMQDIPSSCGVDPLAGDDYPNCWTVDRNAGWTQQTMQQLVDEATEITKETRTHPSIIAMVAFNEGWGQTHDLTGMVVDALKAAAPDKLINEASGWVYYGNGDIVDLHHYPDPDSPIDKAWLEGMADPTTEGPFKNYDATSPAVFANDRIPIAGEFGGWGRYLPGHMFDGLTSCPMAYNIDRDISAENLTSNVLRLWQEVVPFAQDGELGAAVYTEINDQEGEYNGLWDFSSSVLKLTSEDVLLPLFQNISASFAQAVQFS